jgi:hypothetical protein
MRWAISLAGVLLAGLMAVHLVQDARLARRNGETVAQTLTRYAAQEPGVIIIFQPEDCLGSGDIVRRWNALAGAPALGVQGLVTGKSISAAQRSVFATTGLRMKLGAISPRDAAIVGAKLGYTRTPFALVLDGRGRIAGSFPATQNVPREVITQLISGS